MIHTIILPLIRGVLIGLIPCIVYVVVGICTVTLDEFNIKMQTRAPIFFLAFLCIGITISFIMPNP
jgi:hypothetical protein